MTRKAPSPPPRPKVYATKQAAQQVADTRRCPVCGWNFFSQHDYGGWVLLCSNDKAHRI